MASVTVFEISADPFSNRSVDITQAYSVEIIDNDAFLQDPDPDSAQLNLTSLPRFSGSSQNFSTFESYTGTVNGAPVRFTLIQFSNPRYIIVTSGQAALGDTISDTGFAGTAQSAAYRSLPSFVCFTSGSLILTPNCLRKVETLQPGDPACVAQGQTSTIRWIGRRRLSRLDLQANPHLCPVRIRANSFGHGCPRRDLLVSPQHRIAVTSPVMELTHCEPLMLATAKALINQNTITQETPENGVEYIHILFDQHELVNVEGLWSESFFPGDTTVNAMAPATRRELFELFPELSKGAVGYGSTVLPVLKNYEARALQSVLTAPQLEMQHHAQEKAA